MDIRAIRNAKDHRRVLEEIERLWQAEPGMPEHDRLEVLGILANDYEDRRWPITSSDPVAAIEFQMDQTGYTQADLARLLGSRSRASEILRRKRGLTMEMARRLHREWHIPAECLIAAAPSGAAALRSRSGSRKTSRSKARSRGQRRSAGRRAATSP